MWHRRVKQRRETHKKGNTQRKALKLKFLLLIIQVWKPSNTEKVEERDQPMITHVGTIRQMLK